MGNVQDPLLTPLPIKNLTLRNRIVSTSHEPGYGEAGMPTERYRAYHVEKARGGVGLTMIGGSSVVSRWDGDTSCYPPGFQAVRCWRR